MAMDGQLNRTLVTTSNPAAVQLGFVVGSTTSHCKIFSELGKGGMGVDCKAEAAKPERA